MHLLSSVWPITLPLEDPILKFMLIMAITLAAPLIFNKLKISYLLGLIIAGAIIGSHGLNLVTRDSSIILSGTAGLLYIMFLSGLEMDMNDFKQNALRSLTFGIYTFVVPMIFGIVAGWYLLDYPLLSSILLAALLASQTLIAYPLISRLGISRDKAVTIAIGGTVITDILSLMVLTAVVGVSTGSADQGFWVRLLLSVTACVAAIMGLFPMICRWFFKRVSDSISQYVFVLVMLFLGAFLTQLAGLEPIIGAFLTGLAMSRLVPGTSPLMNRIQFIGNAIFIPFFLISVGMLIDFRVFFTSWASIKVSLVMIVMATLAKYVAALLTQKTFRLSGDQRTLIFGLSTAHVAATLAAVMVGYNVILGEAADGTPIRLLDESVLNGAVLMILVTCIISTFASQRAAHKIAMSSVKPETQRTPVGEHVLIPVSHEEDTEELVGLSLALTKERYRSLYALNVVDIQNNDASVQKSAMRLLDRAVSVASAADIHLHRLLRYDVNIVNAIVSTVRERNITDLVLGMHIEGANSSPAIGLLSQGPAQVLGKTLPAVLAYTNVTTYIYRSVQPFPTIRRHIVLVPRKAEMEAGFQAWLLRIRHLAHDTGAQLDFYASETTLQHLRGNRSARQDIARYVVRNGEWEDLNDLLQMLRQDDCLWVVMSRREGISYQPAMARIPALLNDSLSQNNFVLLYPTQAGEFVEQQGVIPVTGII